MYQQGRDDLTTMWKRLNGVGKPPRDADVNRMPALLQPLATASTLGSQVPVNGLAVTYKIGG